MARSLKGKSRAGGESVITTSASTAEVSLLASMLEYPEAYHQAISMGLRPEDFVHSHYRLVFRKLLALAEAHQPLCYESLICEAEKEPNFADLVAAISDLTNPLHLPRKDVEWLV